MAVNSSVPPAFRLLSHPLSPVTNGYSSPTTRPEDRERNRQPATGPEDAQSGSEHYAGDEEGET